MLCMTLYNMIHVFKKQNSKFSEKEKQLIEPFDFSANNIFI